MELWLIPGYGSIFNSGLLLQKYTALLSVIQRNVSTPLYMSAVDTRRQNDENPNSSFSAETMKLLAESPHDDQILDCSRHTVTKYCSDDKTNAATNSKLFKQLDYVNNSLYEVKLAKAQIGHKEPIIAGIFILQNAKLRMLDLYYNSFIKFGDVNKLEELQKDTDSLYLAFAEKELEDCQRPEMRAEWQRLRSNDCVNGFTSDAVANVFPPNMLFKTQTTW